MRSGLPFAQIVLEFKSICYNVSSYSKLTEIFSNTLGKHAPLKFEIIRNNQVPLINKKLCKAIMKKSGLRNKYIK